VITHIVNNIAMIRIIEKNNLGKIAIDYFFIIHPINAKAADQIFIMQ
jgi:hypothetical protein